MNKNYRAYFSNTRYNRLELHLQRQRDRIVPFASQEANQSSQLAGWADMLLGAEVELSRTRGVRNDGAGTARRGATWRTPPTRHYLAAYPPSAYRHASFAPVPQHQRAHCFTLPPLDRLTLPVHLFFLFPCPRHLAPLLLTVERQRVSLSECLLALGASEHLRGET
jgi:hypothetical protein